MKTFVGLLLALLMGVGLAFFKPAQPVQVAAGANKPAFAASAVAAENLLDNPSIKSDDKIQPARKCGFCMG